jgi:hypothetical protein
MKTSFLVGLSLILALAACTALGTPTPPPAPATETAAPAPTQAPTVASGLTLEQLRNMAYQLQSSGTPRSVTLTDGAFASPDPAAPDYARIDLLDEVALGDLDGDGNADAAVLLAENYGGTGHFVSLIAMLNRNGAPEQGPSAYIDDRPHINSLTVENGVITLDVVLHAPNDPMCCGTERTLMTFRLTDAGLTPESITTFTPDGRERSITIEFPVEGAEVSGSVQLTGSLTISPFESTLAYKLYDAGGADLGTGPITVSAAEMGGPGTFETTVEVSHIPAGTALRIAVQDISAADGSVMAMDSVSVVVK